MTPWTAEREALLRELWAEGLGCVLIARRLRTTKDAIIGKAHRLGLPPHVRPPDGRKRAAPLPWPRPERIPLDPGTCRWALSERPWRFCDAPVARPGEGWCAAHRAIVYHRRAA